MFPKGLREFYATISHTGIDPKKVKDEFIEKQK